MFVNAALNAPNKKPGEYPSAGPLPHLLDIWKVAAPNIDFYSPDFYNPRFKHWNDLYTRNGNPLFIPEHRFDSTVAAKAIYAIGHYEAIGFSPFSIESNDDVASENLSKMYGLINQLSAIITTNHGRNTIEGVLLDKENPETTFTLGDYEFIVKHSHTLGWESNAKNEVWEPAGAIFIRTGENEFYIAGTGIVATFKNTKLENAKVGILKNTEISKIDDNWKVLRHLNGDQTHQGRHIRIFLGNYIIQKLELNNYD